MTAVTVFVIIFLAATALLIIAAIPPFTKRASHRLAPEPTWQEEQLRQRLRHHLHEEAGRIASDDTAAFARIGDHP